MGSREDKIWKHWDPIDPSNPHQTSLIRQFDEKKKYVKCCYCKGHPQIKNAPKCKVHTTKCHAAPVEVRNEFKLEIELKDKQKFEPHHDNGLTSEGFGCQNAGQVSRSSQDQVSCSQTFYVARMSKAKKEDLKDTLTKAFITGNVPFDWVTNFYWKKFVFETGIFAVIPTQYEMANLIQMRLNKWATNEVNNLVDKVETVTIALDNWTNVRKKSVINMMLCTPQSIFYKSIEVDGDTEDAPYYSDLILKEIVKLGIMKVSAVISDHAAAYVSAKKLISNVHPHIIGVGCSAHLANLLIKDLMKLKSLDEIIDEAKCIINTVTLSKKMLGLWDKIYSDYINDQAQIGVKKTHTALCRPSETRWYSYKNMLASLLKARDVVELFVNNPQALASKEIKDLAKSDDFWAKIEKANELMSPLVEGKKRLTYIIDAANLFLFSNWLFGI